MAKVQNIENFEFMAYIPPVFMGWPSAPIAEVGRTTYVKMLDVLDAAKFHYEEELSMRVTDRGFEIRYGDPDAAFEFGLVDNRLILRRSGSSMQRFEWWYRAFMPSLGSLVDSVLRRIEELAHWEGMSVLRSHCGFRIIAYDFRRAGEDTTNSQDDPSLASLKNTQVISRLISSVPGENGNLVGPENVMSALGRVDYGASRWVEVPNGGWVREIYSVEAPGNRNYSSVWLTLGVNGETFSGTGDQERYQFDFNRFMSQNGLDFYDDFFIKRFIGSFFGDLFEGLEFETTTDVIP
jgi:hypothetical protein